MKVNLKKKRGSEDTGVRELLKNTYWIKKKIGRGKEIIN